MAVSLDSARVLTNLRAVRRLFLLLCLIAVTTVTRADAPGQPVPAAQAPVAELSTRDAIVLGLVEGITEFLPVSSTGHLIIATHFLGLESEAPLVGADGQPLWLKPPSEKHPDGVPLTLKEVADSYTVIIQVGAILAVLLLYRAQFASIFQGLLGKNAAGLRLLRNVILAFLPAAAIGFAVHDLIDAYLFSIQTVAVAGISGAVLMFYAERYRKEKSGPGTSRLEPADLSPKQALGIGFMQCLALWPGTSRSMVTMVGGYFTGLSPAKAAEFSFLVGLPTLAGAALLKFVKIGPLLTDVFGVPNVLLGIAVACVSAGIAVKWLVGFLSRHGLTPFAIYRILLAVFLLVWFGL